MQCFDLEWRGDIIEQIEFLSRCGLQIHLCPVSDMGGALLTGRGPRPEGAPHVITRFLAQDSWQGSRGWLRPSCPEPELQAR